VAHWKLNYGFGQKRARESGVSPSCSNGGVALEIDTTRAFASPARKRELVAGIRDAPKHESEPSWLEWKGAVDFSQKRWYPEIACHCMGLANRNPDHAQRTAEGMGYVVVGAEPGNLCGAGPIDNARLEEGLAVYLGRGGPQVSFDYVDVDGIDVLVISVQPPRWGDPIHAFAKAFHAHELPKADFKKGDVFVRREGRTARAEPEDYRMLERRFARTTAQPALDVDLQLAKEASPITPIDDSPQSIVMWIDRERSRLRRPPDPLPTGPKTTLARPPGARPPGDVTLDMIRRLGVTSEPEQRSPKEYDAAVEQYVARAYEELPKYLRYRAVQEELAVLRLRLCNNTPDNYEGVAVVLTFGGHVSAYTDKREAAWELYDDSNPKFPGAPRKWGPRQVTKGLPRSILRGDVPLLTPPLGPNPRKPRIDNSASARIEFHSVHLRPRYSVKLEDVHLIVPASEAAAGQITGEWYATSTSVSGMPEGTLLVPLNAPINTLDLLTKKSS
jgi:hypothetical protein